MCIRDRSARLVEHGLDGLIGDVRREHGQQIVEVLAGSLSKSRPPRSRACVSMARETIALAPSRWHHRTDTIRARATRWGAREA
eukprot:1677642-Prymnesium_polylepis.1